jgi:phosphate-selective porin OprO and OprP
MLSRSAGGLVGTMASFCLAVLFLLTLPAPSRAQTESPASLDTTIAAGEADAQEPVPRGLAKYNNFDLGFTTFRIGYGFLVDFATYSQDDVAKQQVETEPDVDLRDFRLMFKGKFKTERPLTWTMGIMWDKGIEDWVFRQTGIMVGVPEISSHFFLGRTKEGYSQYKQMVGYDIWTIERSPFLDAFIPIMADGFKWMGYAKKHHLLWNLGYFTDVVSEKEKFSTYDYQLVGRLIYLPIMNDSDLLHLAVMGRDVKPDDGVFQARSRPEAYLAPYYVDTGKFASDHANTFGIEAYYRKGSWLFSGEYDWQAMDADTSGNPTFHGGNVSASWLVTGETRGYNTVSGYFKAVSPKRTVFEGGPGAVELTLNYSYIDLDSGNLKGGKFWRITPAVKWHLMDYLRIELAYGYGRLDRFGQEGTTQFFQGRFLTAL